MTTSTRTVVVERLMPHPPEKIWRALTEGALIEQWLMKNDFEPTVGRRFHFRAEPNPHWNGVTACEVITVDPPRTLAYHWRSSGEEAADGLDTIVTWTLTPAEGGTFVRMEHSGFGFGPGHDGFYQGAGYGWNRFVAALETTAAGLD